MITYLKWFWVLMVILTTTLLITSGNDTHQLAQLISLAVVSIKWKEWYQ